MKTTPSSLSSRSLSSPSRLGTPSPARLTAEATLKLPRWALVALCLLYILPGLVGRDPWKSEDASAFGVMWTMAHGTGYGGIADWLLPNVFGAPVVDSGPLMYWVGAGCILLFGKIVSADLAARLATVIFFFVAVTSIWYATYLVGRRRAAQPAVLAFGGQPDPRDYGRVLADGALLILLATVGLLIRAHESSSDVAMLAMLGVGLYGMARSIEEPRAGAGWIALSVVGLVLSRGPAPAIAMTGLWLALLAFDADFKPSRRAVATITAPLVIAGLAVWPLATWILIPGGGTHIAQRLGEWWQYFDGIDAQAFNKDLRTLPWSTWIAWPLALWAVWSWRDRLREAQFALPGGFVIAMVLVLCSTSDTSDGQLLLVLPGLVMLAAFGLPTLRRGGANAFDWFSLLLYSLTALLIWFTWFTKVTGVPAGFARSLARLTPGAAYHFQPLIFALAIAATVAWIALVRWRLVSHPKVLWRSVVLASGGVILAWTLTSTLFLRTIDYGRSYRTVALQIAAAIAGAERSGDRPSSSTAGRRRGTAAPGVTSSSAASPSIASPSIASPSIASPSIASPSSASGRPVGACVATDGVGLAQRASFAWIGNVHFAQVDDAGKNADDCDYLLVQDQNHGAHDALPQGGKWRLVWEGRRVADRDERFRLFRKTGGASTKGASDAIDRNDTRDAPFNAPPPAGAPAKSPAASTDAPSSADGVAAPAPASRSPASGAPRPGGR